MHGCPNCGCVCDCDGEDVWHEYGSAVEDCEHGCLDTYDDDDDDQDVEATDA